MSNTIGQSNDKQTQRETGRLKSSLVAPFSFLHSALRRLRFTNFRPLFTSKVLAKPPLWRRSSRLNFLLKRKFSKEISTNFEPKVNSGSKLDYYIKGLSNFRKLAYVSAVLLLFLSIGIIAPIYFIPENSEATTGTATESSITFTSTSSTASATLDVTSINGNFATSTPSQQISFSLSTTNYTGYTLKLKLSDSTNTLSNGTDTLAMIANSATSGNFTNNSWGLLPSKYNSNDNTNTYYPITTTGIIMHETSGANSISNPNNYTISLGLKADYSKSAGTYTSNKVILEYIANPVNYVITYDKNTTDAVTNMPYGSNNNQQAGDTSATSITLSSLVPIRDGYTFKGWCSVAVADGGTCSGTTYNPDGAGTSLSYGIDQTTMNETTIYAIWEKASWGYIQDMDVTTCESLASDANLTVTDRRDNNDYTIRYINSNCWMTQNLRITASTGQPAGIILSVDSDFSAASITIVSGTDFNDYGTAQYYDSGNTNTGVWYSFCAASAKSGTGSCERVAYSGDESICPSGWRLPLKDELNSTKKYASAFSPVAGGLYYNGSLSNVGGGYYWSATEYSYSNGLGQYSLFYSGGTGGLNESWEEKERGIYARCIKKGPFDDFAYMQDITAAAIDAAPDGSTGTLTDRRDGNTYSVAKINGRLWMTQNLRITASSGKSAGVISAADSNFTGDDITMTNGTNFNDVVAAQYYDSGNTSTGVWYSFCAAGAKNNDACNNANSYTGSDDICPGGWRLPINSEFSTIQTYGAASTSGFSPIAGGYYGGGTLNYPDYAYWWSATARNRLYQYTFYYNGSGDMSLVEGGVNSKFLGHFIRCIADPPLTMQEATDDQLATLMPDEGDTATLTDSRDGSDYQITKINGNYWMTQNLRFTWTSDDTLTSDTTHVSGDTKIAIGTLTSGNSYTEARIQYNNNTSYGAYYNYCAASAGTVCSQTQANASYDICPKSWRLPTNSEFSGITSQSSAFSPVYSGNYNNGSLYNTGSGGYGFWWSATAVNANLQYYLFYRGGSLGTGSGNSKNYGFSVRCVRI